MRLSESGQSSFEILLLTAIVFAGVIWVSGHYLDIRDSTLSLQMAKIHTLSQIGKSDDALVIENLDFEESVDGTSITIRIDVADLLWDCGNDLNYTGLAANIVNNTDYASATIELNGGVC
ncbi:MAG: hypothetical protein QGI60_04875 [archaeon]|jgi:hypothetical protein|nr:hypothetical protein [archaeon]